MTTKTIPQQTIVTCDRCGRDITKSHRAMRGAIHVERAGLDFQGVAVASNDIDFDLCDPCLTTVVAALESAMVCPN